MIKYVIITPVRDEEQYIEQTIMSDISQTVRPIKWIIVNDGSSDDTGKIIDSFAKQHQWIYTVHRENRGFRQAGGGVMEAFYDGYRSLASDDWEFIVKLDGDLSFGSDYFESCFKEFRQNPKLGIAGGGIYQVINTQLKLEKNPIFHVRGATKIYRHTCWESIGGLLKAPGWDTLDEVKANMLGWISRSFPEKKVVHHRPTGTAESTWRNLVKDGRADYISGYHPIFMLLKCLRRITRKPYVIHTTGLLYGFLTGYLTKAAPVNDPALIKYLRKQQLRKIFLKSTIWK